MEAELNAAAATHRRAQHLRVADPSKPDCSNLADDVVGQRTNHANRKAVEPIGACYPVPGADALGALHAHTISLERARPFSISVRFTRRAFVLDCASEVCHRGANVVRRELCRRPAVGRAYRHPHHGRARGGRAAGKRPPQFLGHLTQFPETRLVAVLN